MAAAASNRLNYDNGYKVENPNYVSTATYTLAAGDGAVVNTTTANQRGRCRTARGRAARCIRSAIRSRQMR